MESHHYWHYEPSTAAKGLLPHPLDDHVRSKLLELSRLKRENSSQLGTLDDDDVVPPVWVTERILRLMKSEQSSDRKCALLQDIKVEDLVPFFHVGKKVLLYYLGIGDTNFKNHQNGRLSGFRWPSRQIKPLRRQWVRIVSELKDSTNPELRDQKKVETLQTLALLDEAYRGAVMPVKKKMKQLRSFVREDSFVVSSYNDNFFATLGGLIYPGIDGFLRNDSGATSAPVSHLWPDGVTPLGEPFTIQCHVDSQREKNSSSERETFRGRWACHSLRMHRFAPYSTALAARYNSRNSGAMHTHTPWNSLGRDIGYLSIPEFVPMTNNSINRAPVVSKIYLDPEKTTDLSRFVQFLQSLATWIPSQIEIGFRCLGVDSEISEISCVFSRDLLTSSEQILASLQEVIDTKSMAKIIILPDFFD
eukprot:Rmarinus@m.26816